MAGGLTHPAANPAKKSSRKPPPAKIDPKLLKAARELRDRYLEQVNAVPNLPSGQGKYDVSRMLEAPEAPNERAFGAPRQLPLAA